MKKIAITNWAWKVVNEERSVSVNKKGRNKEEIYKYKESEGNKMKISERKKVKKENNYGLIGSISTYAMSIIFKARKYF